MTEEPQVQPVVNIQNMSFGEMNPLP
jgi:hypothetical protein